MQTLSEVGSSSPFSPPDESTHLSRAKSSRFQTFVIGWIRKSSLSFLVVFGVTLFVFFSVRPDLLFSSSLDVGGDNAAHIVAPWFMIHNLLAHGEVSGWDPQWFNGFPLYVFYFPLPAVFVAILTLVAPYAVAFKLITVAGSVSLPIAAYLFGRLCHFRRPVPEFFAIATLPYLFNTSYTIDGGNLASTMAGEFSYSLSISFGLLFLGVFVHALRTGRKRWLASLLFAMTLLCHVVPALFFAGTAVLMAIAYYKHRPLRVLVPVALTGGLLSAFWLFPFGAYLKYTSSMGYTPVSGFAQQIFPKTGMLAVTGFALIGALYGISRKERVILALTAAALLSTAAFQFLPSGLVYNGRWLPFWFLTTGLLGGYGLSQFARSLFRYLNFQRAYASGAPILAGLGVVLILSSWLGWLPTLNFPVAKQNFVKSWIAWNYSGYQSKAGWPEYERLVAMLKQQTAIHGCGRLDYEYSPNVSNYFGSTLTPIAFPYFTNGCVDVAEGLYYESSTSSTFHFLDQAELSIQASNPMVGIPYQTLDVADGIRHLQLQGEKYFLANSPEVERQAALDPSLVQLASVATEPTDVDGYPPAPTGKTAWVLYEIKDSPLVAPEKYVPVVESGLNKLAWRSVAISWYQDEHFWPVPIAASGPSTWPAANKGALVDPKNATKLPSTSVSDIVSGTSSLSFSVTKIGVPVLVKIPYFPNWHVTGATGPYETTPNLMIVVPTQHHVVLNYGTTKVDVVGKLATGAGLLGLIALRHDAHINPVIDRDEDEHDDDEPVETDENDFGGDGDTPEGGSPIAPHDGDASGGSSDLLDDHTPTIDSDDTIRDNVVPTAVDSVP